MKKLILAFAFTGIIVSSGMAQADKKATSDGPEISFEKELHDYGTIDFGGDGTSAFKFTNTGSEALIISDAKGSCGCTVPKFPKEPILKGQSAAINVSYDTKRPGPFTKTVTVTSNAKTATKTLTIKGTVRSQEQSEDQTPVKKGSEMSPFAK